MRVKSYSQCGYSSSSSRQWALDYHGISFACMIRLRGLNKEKVGKLTATSWIGLRVQAGMTLRSVEGRGGDGEKGITRTGQKADMRLGMLVSWFVPCRWASLLAFGDILLTIGGPQISFLRACSHTGTDLMGAVWACGEGNIL